MIAAAKVLIVDDEPQIRHLLRITLARAQYEVCEAGTAGDALALLKTFAPDVVLLDLGLPDRDGMELVPLMKSQSSAVLLVVSAREATEEKVTALDLGADDYMTKPFDTAEVLARVRTALRHRLADQGSRATVAAGDVEIDLLRRRVTKGGSEVHLTPKEYAVLIELAKYPGRVITHDHILRTVWANEFDPHIEYLRVVIRNIRQKLEDDPAAPAIVVNELGVGYRLMDQPAAV
jgi:two-component system KDP operon response regulator KdpE